MLGLFFYIIVKHNRKAVYHLLGIQPQEIIIDNPYYVHTTKAHLGLQIDYMIQTKFNTLYICEIKFHHEKIGMSAADEIKQKIRRLQIPRGFSIRTVLIHVNGVTENLVDSHCFAYIINFSQLLEKSMDD